MRVGVTGHRDAARLRGVRPLVERVLDALTTSGGDDARLIVVSSLAEGADRVVAAAALARGWALEVVLPLERDDYARDFADAASRDRFAALLGRADQIDVIEPQQSRDDAYLATGHAVVDRSDVLVALWDGQPAAGRGGTAEVVEYARSIGRPVAWIVTGSHDSPASIRMEGIDVAIDP